MLGLLGIPIPLAQYSVPVAWAVAVVCGVKTAYTLWLDEHKEKERLQQERKPKIAIRALSHAVAMFDGGAKLIRLEITNNSDSIIKNCSVKELSFVNKLGHHANMTRYFALGEETHADITTHAYRYTFDLKGRGATQIINIAMEDNTKTSIIMLYATTPSSRTLNSIPNHFFPHRLTVIATSDDMIIAEKRTYDISTEGGLKITEVTV
jgi:hypothetical protein